MTFKDKLGIWAAMFLATYFCCLMIGGLVVLVYILMTALSPVILGWLLFVAAVAAVIATFVCIQSDWDLPF